MIEVTTLENEIERHQKIADLMREFEKLSDDVQIFRPSTLAAIHLQTANRLYQLKHLLANMVK